MLDEFIPGHRTAYFSMEVALVNDLSTYSGGLGISASEIIRSV